MLQLIITQQFKNVIYWLAICKMKYSGLFTILSSVEVYTLIL